MSYILDALNKSEQERRGQQTPDLQTVHRSPPPRTESKLPIVWVVGILALINIAGVAYWLGSNDPEPTSAESPSPAIHQSPSSATPVVETTNAQTTEVATISTRPSAQPQTPIARQEVQFEATEGTLITPQTAFEKPNNEAVRITELPVNVQRQIPDLVFSSHLFSDEASFRMVNINGKMRREGDMVANELKLLEISEEGVILGYRHYVFEVSVLRDWSFD